MEILSEEVLKRLELAEICKIRKALNKFIARLRREFRKYQCNKVDEKYYKKHLWYSTVVDQHINHKLRHSA
ncbi:hypothetical protein NVP1081O_309 [Vibrio phage 1.081.O._10N.286.52.C2]|nr:hypothetical protein NVP1081O_309 [Vibrio phage 1.081.O._10N.286.52.C2]